MAQNVLISGKPAVIAGQGTTGHAGRSSTVHFARAAARRLHSCVRMSNARSDKPWKMQWRSGTRGG